MSHGFKSCVLFDYVINDENEKDFPIRDFNVPTNYVLHRCSNNDETYTGFYKFFLLTSYNHF